MSIVEWSIIVLFIMCLKRDVSWVRELTVKKIRKKWEIIAIIVGLVVIGAIVVLYARKPEDFLLVVVAILEFMVTSMNEGISENGVLVGTRYGLHRYPWKNMKRVIVKESDVIKIEYVDIVSAGILSHIYSVDDYDKIKNVLESNGITMEVHKKQ